MLIKNFIKFFSILSLFLLINFSAKAGMSDSDKSKAWECSGIYMANYFLPSGEELSLIHI